jgi:hypothetical protein
MMTNVPYSAPPYAPYSQQPHQQYHSSYPPPPLDAGDQAILHEAQIAQLFVDDKREVTRGTQGQFGRAMGALFLGSHTAERVRTYRVRAPDGFSWTYTQPYSGTAQMPGEHSFILRGAFAAPVQVLPASNQWRRPRFIISFGMVTFCLLFLYGLGLLLPPLMILLWRPWPKWISADPRLAKWLSSQPFVKSAVGSTKWGWLGFMGSRGWRLPWVIQLHSLGDGTSRLVVKSPDIGRVSLMNWRVGFGQAQGIARAIQASLPQGSFAPPQRPLQEPFSA